MSGTGRIAAFALSLALLSLFGLESAAQTVRVETLRWTDPLNAAGSVASYRVRYGQTSGTYQYSLNVGIPSVVTGALQSVATLAGMPLDANVYIVVTAVNGAGVESLYSNEICRNALHVACGTSGGGTTTPPPPTTASAAVVGFALWNAQTDTVIDSSFTSGEKILLANGNCVAIEILTNSYLSASGPGSVKRVFDGQAGACTQAGVTHENNAPYAWEADEGPNRYPCATSLTTPGSHTLLVTPYDGDDCSGAVGTPVTLQFEVVSPTGSGTTLGQPGQPYVVP